jgi:hypothetical protein
MTLGFQKLENEQNDYKSRKKEMLKIKSRNQKSWK